jgi:hypothetical protein
MYSNESNRKVKREIPPRVGSTIRLGKRLLEIRGEGPGDIYYCWDETKRQLIPISRYQDKFEVVADSELNGQLPLFPDPKKESIFEALYRAKGIGNGWFKFPKWSLEIMNGEQALLFNFLVDWMQGGNRGILMRNDCRFWCNNQEISKRLKLGIWIVKKLIDELRGLGFIETNKETKRTKGSERGFRNRRWITIRFDKVLEAVNNERAWILDEEE